MRLIKLMRSNLTTYNGFQWEYGRTEKLEWGGLCGSGCFHAYKSVEMAALLKEYHLVDHYTVAVECETPKIMKDGGTKVGVAELTPLREVNLPHVSIKQVVEFALRVACEVLKDVDFTDLAMERVRGGKNITSRDLYDLANTLDLNYIQGRVASKVIDAVKMFDVFFFGSAIACAHMVIFEASTYDEEIDFDLIAKETLCRK